MPLGSVGRGVSIHLSVVVFGEAHLHVGAHSRIDCFSVITAGPEDVTIGEHVHIGAGCFVSGGGGLVLEDFANLSAGVKLFTSSDDFGDGHFANATAPDRFRNVRIAAVRLGRHVVVGAGSVVLPGVSLGFGAAVGANSVVKHSVDALAIVAGSPARVIGQRDGERLLRLDAEFRDVSARGESF